MGIFKLLFKKLIVTAKQKYFFFLSSWGWRSAHQSIFLLLDLL